LSPRKLTGINGREVVRALRRAGFVELRVTGSHHVLRRPGSPASKVIVPVHGAADLPPGTLRSIIQQSGLTVDEFMSLF
jgi:predicted RNA binding protein YcfA (HicA-like mRNA interferase family)